ncbi:MAG: class I SAM-dependent rRNA methyltransferase [Candidatus Aureabacteria bacterium]|nr:class I SAM-dependent rRNA methyltransferase [Candidatus Auribacterota bacterium]
MEAQNVVISKKGMLWYKTGHAWIYRDDLLKTASARSGDIVDVLDERGKFLGKAFYGEKSKISLRILTREKEVVDRQFFKQRIEKAIARRGERATGRNAARLIFSEGDSLPGLIVDKYAEWIVLQALIPGIESRLGEIADIIVVLLSPRGIVLRNDANARTLEGLPLEKKILRGEKPDLVEITEGEIRYLVDVWSGHKTGAYLDQAENRCSVARHAYGSVLDCFAYQGHFSLHCSSKAESVTAIESSNDSIAMLEKNITLNARANITPIAGNAFDLLRAYHKEKRGFDMIILDPPPLARKRAHADDALRGYKEINLRAMHLLNPGGTLATFSCSHSISRDLFTEIVRIAAADARCGFRVVRELCQASDHPILLNIPETSYLKGLILQKI